MAEEELAATTPQRRRFMRLPGPFDGRWDGASGARVCRITDLNSGGCFIDAYASSPVGTRLTTEVTVSGEGFQLESEVVYVDLVQGFAVRFVDNPPELVDRLTKAIVARST